MWSIKFNLCEEDKNAIFTPPEQIKINEGDQTKLIKEIESRRDQQDNEYANIIKQQQISNILRAEQEKLILHNNLRK